MFSLNWLVIIWRKGELCLELDVQGQRGGRILDVDEPGGEGSWKWDNFHGRHMCIVPKTTAIWVKDLYHTKLRCNYLYPN